MPSHLAVRSGKKVQTSLGKRGQMRVLNDTKNIVILAFFENNLIKIQLFYKKTQYFRFCFFSILVFRSNKILILGDRLSFQSYQISWQLQSGHAVNQPTHAHSGPIWYHQEPSDILYSCRFLQQEGSEAFIQQ